MITSLISLFIQNADASAVDATTEAAANGAAQGGFMGQYSGLIMIALLFIVFYFLLIRPQQKKQKEIRKMRESLKAGDTVITAGGIYGRITDVKENAFIISISDGVRIKIDKGSVYQSPEDVQQASQGK